jgi:hypothetical protein
MVWTKLLSHMTLAAALAGGVLFFGAARVAHADDDDVASCRRNVDKWEDRLHHDIDRHGPDSRQAQHDRHELDEARDNCHKRFGNRWHDSDEHHEQDYDRH